MFHLQPVREEDASKQVKEIYTSIKATLGIAIVPLVFTYIANYEEYLAVLWKNIASVLNTNTFQTTQHAINNFITEAVGDIYHPSSEIEAVVKALSQGEKEQIEKTVVLLERVNSELFLLMLGIRESVKGVLYTGEEISSDRYLLDKTVRQHAELSFGDTNKKLSPEETLLAPLFGSSSLSISIYPRFFSLIAKEAERLVKDEQYVEKRVQLEQKGLLSIDAFPQLLVTSYNDFVMYVGKQPYVHELLYLLSNTFPTAFPKLLFTTGIMRKALFFEAKAVQKL